MLYRKLGRLGLELNFEHSFTVEPPNFFSTSFHVEEGLAFVQAGSEAACVAAQLHTMWAEHLPH